MKISEILKQSGGDANKGIELLEAAENGLSTVSGSRRAHGLYKIYTDRHDKEIIISYEVIDENREKTP